MEATVLLARQPPGADEAWLRRSLVALAQRFADARVRLLVADAEARAAAGVRRAPPPASFDAVVLVERAKPRWAAPPGPALARSGEALAWLAGARGHRAVVREVLPRAAPVRAAQRSPGLVFVASAVRAAQLDPDAFDAYWRDRHAPLALRHHAGMHAYEQFAFRSALTAGAPAADGLALLHFPSAEAWTERFYDSDAGRAAIAEDTARFLDLARCEAALMSEWGARA